MSFNQPGRGDVHVDRPLTEISIAFRQDSDAFVADRVFPIVRVSKQSDKYFTIPRGEFFRDAMEKRAAGAAAAAANWKVSTDSYSCDVWALATDIPDQVRANYDAPLDADLESTTFLMGQAMISKERQFSTQFMTTSVWTLDQTGVDSATPGANEFGRFDRSDSKPIQTMRRLGRIVHERTGFRPNKLVLGREVYDALLDNESIVGRLDRGQTSGPAQVMRANLAALFELDEVLVMDSVHNSAVEGAADVFDYIGGKSALLLYTPAAPGLRTPSAGYTMAWTGLMGGSALGQRMKRIRREVEESDRLEIQMAYDHKLVSADLGIFMETAVN